MNLSNNQSRATLWVLDTCLIVGLRSLMIILTTASLSSKMYSLGSPWEIRVFAGTWSTWLNWSTFRLSSTRLVLVWDFGAASRFQELVIWGCSSPVFVRKTSITISQRSKASDPSIRSPASNEITSDSAEWETEVCFLHIQLTSTNVRLPEMHKTHPKVDIESSRSPAKSESWKKKACNAVPCFPHDNIVGNRLCDVRKQPCLSSVACLSPFCDCSCNLELMIIQTRVRDFVKLLHYHYCQFTVSLNAFLSISFHFAGPRSCLCVSFFCHPGNFSVAPAEIRDSHILSSIFTSVLADTASAACPSQPGNLATTSMIFGAVIWDADEPCSVSTA